MTAKEQEEMDFGADSERMKKRTVEGGLLITFEGGEGVGKSTQSERLFHKLQSFGIDTVHAQEPGSSDLGNNVRRWIKRSNSSSPLAETLLFEAARAQLMFETVRPALDRGKVVVLDRYIDSTLAYQGYARGGDLKTIKQLNDIATAELTPHLTVLLDLDPKVSLARVSNKPDLFSGDTDGSGRVDNENERRFEQAPLKFHQSIRKGYLEMSKTDPRWCVIKADQAGHRIADAILKRVRRLLIDGNIPESIFKS
ncbi:MAG TPA: dTMP kinase [Dehalococcoidia bacterium]|nr:dTMP kinase [Dehalococcoidia bacterium]HIK89378.1 dTMP kinase [Dehalococcoidia bacterium]